MNLLAQKLNQAPDHWRFEASQQTKMAILSAQYK